VGWLPTGGSGDSGNPACNREDFGWTYEILPYIEQLSVYDMAPDSWYDGTNHNGVNDNRILRQTPIPVYNCPARRPNLPSAGTSWTLVDGTKVNKWAKSDYAGNGGSEPTVAANWTNGPIVKSLGSKKSFKQSHIKILAVTDGTANTLLVGEKL